MPWCWAVGPQPQEFELRNRWIAPLLDKPEPAPRPHLEMLYQDAADGISRGQSWRGTPYQLGDKTYTNGLAFNSTKHLLVVLDRPAERFTAEVGLENNDDTQRGAATGNGSVTFHVLVGDKEVLTTPVLRLKDGPHPIDVPLNGARQFEIRVKDGGDGRGWDQALWADATVKLQDGGSIRLQDLPLGDTAPKAISVTEPPFSFVYDGKPSSDLLKTWQVSRDAEKLDAQRTRHTLTYTDPATGLQVRCVLVEYDDFPTVEWTLYFKNTGSADTPILEKIQALDIRIDRSDDRRVPAPPQRGLARERQRLRPAGDAARARASASIWAAPAAGRPTPTGPTSTWNGAAKGVIVVVGWPGPVGGRVRPRRRAEACTCRPARS